MSEPYQVRLPGFSGEGSTLWQACGRSPRRAAQALLVTWRRWYRGLDRFDRRREDAGAPGGVERRAA